MPIYEYECKGCGKRVESTRILDPETRHLNDEPGDAVCGTLRRVWQVYINKENIRAVPRG